MKIINVKTNEIRDLKDLGEEELLDYWHAYEPEEFSVEDLLYVYEKIKKFAEKIIWEDGKGGKEITEEEMVEKLKEREFVVVKLKNGFGYVLCEDAIGHPLLGVVRGTLLETTHFEADL